MAEQEGSQIIKEASNRFLLKKAACLHREGFLNIGDLAVWVGVSSVHRKDAFAACRYIIDQVKMRVPIWKKEYYHDKEAQWVSCPHCATHENMG